MLADALQSFRITREVRKVIQTQLNQCGSSAAPVGTSLPNPAQLVIQISTGASVSGKEGYLFMSSDSKGASDSVVAPVSADALERRRIPIGTDPQMRSDFADMALRQAQTLLGWQIGYADVQPFFVVSAEVPDKLIAKSVGTCLIPYKTALEHSFDMHLPPDRLVMVYALVFPQALPEFGKTLHGIKIPPGTVAYSVYEDLSMVGVAGPESCGTLAHELTHLMIRSNFGNSPPWLEEGLASEVAVARPLATGFTWMKSWRDDMLRSQWANRPTVSQLLDMNWDNFVASDQEDLGRAAAVNGMAASFVRFLGNRGKLKDVFFSLRDLRFPQGTDMSKTDQQILESSLGETMEDIDKDFSRWLNDQYKVSKSTSLKKPSGSHPH
jgi:hypothetical protein